MWVRMMRVRCLMGKPWSHLNQWSPPDYLKLMLCQTLIHVLMKRLKKLTIKVFRRVKDLEMSIFWLENLVMSLIMVSLVEMLVILCRSGVEIIFKMYQGSMA